jgi:hypothetical protein
MYLSWVPKKGKQNLLKAEHLAKRTEWRFSESSLYQGISSDVPVPIA